MITDNVSSKEFKIIYFILPQPIGFGYKYAKEFYL